LIKKSKYDVFIHICALIDNFNNGNSSLRKLLAFRSRRRRRRRRRRSYELRGGPLDVPLAL